MGRCAAARALGSAGNWTQPLVQFQWDEPAGPPTLALAHRRQLHGGLLAALAVGLCCAVTNQGCHVVRQRAC